MNLLEVRNNVLRVLWLEQLATVPSYIYEDVTTAINSALQLINQSPLDYFRKEEIDVSYGVGESSKNLYDEASVQEVIGPVWIPAENDRELHRITDQSEWNQFYQRYFGKSEDDAIADGMQRSSYYFIRTRRSYSEDSGKDSSELNLDIRPTPTSITTLRLLVAKSPAVFSVATITSLTGTEVTPVPADKVETILLPLARWYAMRSHFFFEKDKIELINADAERAMIAIKVNDPAMGTASHMNEQLKKQAERAE